MNVKFLSSVKTEIYRLQSIESSHCTNKLASKVGRKDLLLRLSVLANQSAWKLYFPIESENYFILNDKPQTYLMCGKDQIEFHGTHPMLN